MPKAYWVGNVEVTDADVYGEYAKIAQEAIHAHGGKFLARGGRYVQCEGRERARNVVVEFPSLDVAVECYNSERYQEAVSFAAKSSIRDLVLIEGAD